MPGKHTIEFHCSLILVKCCSPCVGSYLKITCRSITVLLIKKKIIIIIPEAHCSFKKSVDKGAKKDAFKLTTIDLSN